MIKQIVHFFFLHHTLIKYMLLFSCLYPIKLRIFKYLLLSCIFLFSIVQGMYCKGYVMIHTMFAFISIFFVCVISKLTLRYYAYLFLKDTYIFSSVSFSFFFASCDLFKKNVKFQRVQYSEQILFCQKDILRYLIAIQVLISVQGIKYIGLFGY